MIRLGITRFQFAGGLRGYQPLLARYASKVSFTAEKPSEIKLISTPLGVDQPENSGQRVKTFEEKKNDFLDMKKNRQRREELKKELAKSSFAPIYEFRDTGGKFFRLAAPISSSEAQYFPDLGGISIRDGTNTSIYQWIGEKDVSIVRIFSSDIGQKQIESYLDAIDFTTGKLDLIDINLPTSAINRFLVKWFTKRILKSLKGDYQQYLIADNVDVPTRQSIGAANQLGGYFYVVDKTGRIRWAASGSADEQELETLQSVVKDLTT